MPLRVSVFMILVAFFALISYSIGSEENIGQGLCVDGSGGYLPDGDYLNSDTSQAQMSTISQESFADPESLINPESLISPESLMDHLVWNEDFLSILSYWEKYL